jgi:GNAT superfamily N-acetyltransferase
MASVIGWKAVRGMYGYIDRSKHEYMRVQERDGVIVGVYVLSLSPHTLVRRLLVSTWLLLWTAMCLFRVPWVRIIRQQMVSTPETGGTPRRHETEVRPEVLLLFTDPVCRGQGIGGELMAQGECVLREHGFGSYVVKTISAASNRALGFYEGLGFVPVADIRKHGKSYRVFEKPL